MYQLEVKIKLLADLLFNPLSESDSERIVDSETGGRKSREEKMKAASQKIYRNGHNLVVPKHMLDAVLLCGCKMAKLSHGKSALWKYLKATVFVENDADLGTDEPDYMHHATIIKKDGTVVACFRPAIKVGRQIAFTISALDDNITVNQIANALRAGGIYCGLGSNRPRYGRYEVMACKKVE